MRMTTNHQRPEGALIESALRRNKLSARKAADRAGMSDARWRQIVNGYQSAGSGQTVKVKGPAETIARMASVVGVSAAELRAAGRGDAADAMADPFDSDIGKSAVAHVLAQLNPALARFTDHELTTEIQVRMLLMASKLQAHGDATLTFIVDEAGDRVVTSRPSSEPL